MITKGKISSIENGKYKITIKDKENVVSGLLDKAAHVGLLEVGDSVVAVFFNDVMTGIIIAKY